MEHLEVILPLTILVLAFVLKLAIDRSVEVPSLLQALCELPVDMIFLSISFLIAFTISKPADPSEGLFYIIAFIVLAVIIVIFWRKSLKHFEDKKMVWILLFCVNMVLSVFSLYSSVSILLADQEITKTESNDNVTKPKDQEDGY